MVPIRDRVTAQQWDDPDEVRARAHAYARPSQVIPVSCGLHVGRQVRDVTDLPLFEAPEPRTLN